MTYRNLNDYLTAMDKWLYAPASIDTKGRMKVLVNGRWVSHREFARQNPKPNYHPIPKANPDSTRIPN